MPQVPSPPSRVHRSLIWLRAEILPLLALVVLMLAARSSFANHYHVPTGSMQPALEPGDRVVVDMRAYGWRVPFTSVELRRVRDPEPGEVVVFASPADGTRLVKRVVAVAGDRVELADGRLRVNGVALQSPQAPDAERFERRLVTLELRHGGGPDIQHSVVPPGMALVLGDHRGNSVDGRDFGLVPLDAFYGRAVAVYYRQGEGLGWKRL